MSTISLISARCLCVQVIKIRNNFAWRRVLIDLLPTSIFLLLIITFKFPIFPVTSREDRALLFEMDDKLSKYEGQHTHGLITRDAWWDWFDQVRLSTQFISQLFTVCWTGGVGGRVRKLLLVSAL